MPTIELDITVYCPCGRHLTSQVSSLDGHHTIELNALCASCLTIKYEAGYDAACEEFNV